MILLLYWLVCAVVLGVLQRRAPSRIRWVRAVLIVAGLAGVFGMTRVSWTVQVHAALTCGVIGVQLLAACWVGRLSAVPPKRRAEAVEAFAWLWLYLAVTQVAFIRTMAGDVLPLVAGLCVVGIVGGRAIRQPQPVAALGGMVIAWGLEALWSAALPPAALFIPQKTGRWLDTIELVSISLSPVALAAAALVALLVRTVIERRRGTARRQVGARPWTLAGPVLLPLAAWGLQALAGASLPLPGSVLSAADVAALLPTEMRRASTAYAPAIPLMDASRSSQPKPAWLYFSNNPECVPEDGLATCRVLARNVVPAGSGRLMISHFITDRRPQSLVVEYANLGEKPADLVVRRFEVARGVDAVGLPPESGVGLWELFARADGLTRQHLGPGATWRQRFDARAGAFMAMGDVDCTAPLTVTTALLEKKAVESDEPLGTHPVLPLKGAQTRGVFPHPDQSIRATFDLDAGKTRRLTLATDPLPGQDGSGGEARPASLQGRYGGISHVRVTVHRSATGRYHRLLLVLVPTGGWAGALFEGSPRAIDSHCGLVLCNQRVENRLEFKYEFTLPANSSAPIHLVAIPRAE